jgi:hypothetical protein
MLLEDLRVTHLSKRNLSESARQIAELDQKLSHAFVLDTCQRKIWITLGCTLHHEQGTSSAEQFSGAAAYRFLLRVATGLESEIVGETDVFGQLKDAWSKFEKSGHAWSAELSPWTQKIFEDTKEIRSNFMQDSGGSSYGSLVRRLIRQLHTSPQEPILIVGAGLLARSIAPWLHGQELWLWNRSERALNTLADELESKPGARVTRIHGAEAEQEAWQQAAHVIVCIPADPAGDKRRIQWWSQGVATSSHPKALIHLGGMRDELSAWNGLPGFRGLEDVFGLQKLQGEARSVRFARAIRACDEKALLRSLPGSTSGSATLPHGWEDLAAFG